MRKLQIPLAAVLLFSLAVVAWATDPARTAITIDGLHCPSCAKKVAARLQEVPGVAAVSADVPASKVFVTPGAAGAIPEGALWEAVEKAGFRPTRLEGPNGTFTSKPRT